MRRLIALVLILSSFALAGCSDHKQVTTDADTWMVVDRDAPLGSPHELQVERCTRSAPEGSCDTMNVDVSRSCFDSSVEATGNKAGTFLTTKALKECLAYDKAKDRKRIEGMLDVPPATGQVA